MKSNHRHTRRAAKQTLELGLAVPEVIAYRTARAALAGLSPSPRDRAEFHRMSSEKIAAFYESWNAMFLAMYRANMNVFTSLPAWSTPWTAWPGMASARAQRAAMDIFTSGMAPLHQRAVANAKRLRRVNRRKP
jgi:hypothetical protein